MVNKITYFRFRHTAEDMISKWGMKAVLRRVGMADRWVDVVITNFTPMERTGQMRNPLDRKALVSVKDLTVPPDQERDRLVTYVQPMTNPPVEDETLKIIEPPGRINMGGEVLFWRLAVRK